MIRQVVALTSHGIPFDVAWGLPDETRLAWFIAVGDYEAAINGGKEFDFDTMRWPS